MTPMLDWIFSREWHGRPGEETVSASTDTPEFLVCLDIKLAGCTNVQLIRKEWPSWAWPGGYPIYYLAKDGGVLCSKCANDNIKLTSDPDAARDWSIVAADINYEDHNLYCDNCSQLIEAAYEEN